MSDYYAPNRQAGGAGFYSPNPQAEGAGRKPSRVIAWLSNVWPRARRAAVARSYQTGFGSVQAALMREDLARYCNLRASSFVPGDPLATAFNEGQRDVLLHLMETARLDVTALMDDETEGRDG